MGINQSVQKIKDLTDEMAVNMGLMTDNEVERRNKDAESQARRDMILETPYSPYLEEVW